MNNRERFRANMHFESVDRYLNSEIGVWEQTIDRWEEEGLPKGSIDSIILFSDDKYFGLDLQKELHIEVSKPFPLQGKQVLSEDERYVVFIDEYGIKKKSLKAGFVRGMSNSMDQDLQHPVKNREDWEKWKKKFEGHLEERYPKDYADNLDKLKTRDYVLFTPGLGQLGFYSFLRNMMGTEGASYIFYDDSKLVEEIFDFLAEYFINLLEKAVTDIRLDYFMYFEDLAYNKGPLVSPEMFRKFFIPKYKKINDFLRKNGIDTIFIDSDGNIYELIDLFIESGINGVIPIEVAAGMDVVKLRNKYGRDLCMIGGVDKRALLKDKTEISKEIKRIASVIERGGYIPTVDHLIPPDVSYDNFSYYLTLKRNILQK